MISSPFLWWIEYNIEEKFRWLIIKIKTYFFNNYSDKAQRFRFKYFIFQMQKIIDSASWKNLIRMAWKIEFLFIINSKNKWDKKSDKQIEKLTKWNPAQKVFRFKTVLSV